jgi:hypothetical protein
MKRAPFAALLCLLLLTVAASGDSAPAARDDASDVSVRGAVAFTTSGFVATAGDIACEADKTRGAEQCHEDATGYLMRKVNGPFWINGATPDAILPLGDLQYNSGNLAQFTYRNAGCQYRPPFTTGDNKACSFNESWGRSGRVTEPDTPIRPVTGNHEYESTDDVASCDRLLSLTSKKACGMERYFGDPVAAPFGAGTPSSGGAAYGDGKGNYYYMFDASSASPMLFVALNTGPCSLSEENAALCDGSNQNAAPIRFLRQTLSNETVNPREACVAVYYHQPRWSWYDYPALSFMRGVWNELFDPAITAAQRADVVLNGHAHNYQRFPAVDATGLASPTGVRQIITGTGGNDIDTEHPPCPTGTRCIAPTVADLNHFGAGRLEWDAAAAQLRYSFYGIADNGATQLLDRLTWRCRT